MVIVPQVPPRDGVSRGGAAAAEGEGRALHRGAGAAAAGAMRRVLGPGVGRLLRAHRVHHQGVIHLQGKDYIALHSRLPILRYFRKSGDKV